MAAMQLRWLSGRISNDSVDILNVLEKCQLFQAATLAHQKELG